MSNAILNPDVLLAWLKILGAVAVVLLPSLAWALRKFYPTRTEFDGLGERLTGIHRMAENSNAIAGNALEKAETVERQQNDRWERTVETLERVSRSMERVAEEMQEMQKEQVGITAEQKTLSRDVARLFKKLDL